MRRAVRLVAAALLAAATTVTTQAGTAGNAAVGGSGPADIVAGPPYDFTTELMGQFVFVPLKDQAILGRTKLGYRFRSGQQDSHLVVTLVERGLRFHDRGTKRFKRLSPACRRTPVNVGVAAVCRVPRTISASQPLLVEIWPRLGDDFTDGSTLPRTVAMTVLGDEGHDVARLGAGPDFFNGHSGRDRVRGGAGADWIRAGLDDDVVLGGAGGDRLVGMDGDDLMRSGAGLDRLDGNDGDDRLYAGEGDDYVFCGAGVDTTAADEADRAWDCERVDHG